MLVADRLLLPGKSILHPAWHNAFVLVLITCYEVHTYYGQLDPWAGGLCEPLLLKLHVFFQLMAELGEQHAWRFLRNPP